MNDEAAEQHREAFRPDLVEEPAPADQLEAGKIARAGVPVVLDARPALAERGIDLGINP